MNIVISLLSGPSGMQVEQKRNFTVLSVSDEVFAGDGISSFDDLVAKLMLALIMKIGKTP